MLQVARVFGVAAILGLAGCATYDGLKASEPVASQLVKGDPGHLADCYQDKRLADHVENYQKLELEGGLHLVVRDAPLWGSPNLLYELDFTPVDGGLTRVELRDATKSLFGEAEGNRKIIGLVESCAAPA
jgi:hypothetical protein